MWGIEATHLFDGKQFVDRPTMLIDGNKIVDVGGVLPDSVEIVRLESSTVLPGLVDCHQHLVFNGKGTLEDQVSGFDDNELTDRARNAAQRALSGGVTTVRDLGDRNYVTLGLRGESDLPTLLCAGPPITPPGGHCWYLGGECAGSPDLGNAVRERVERGCDVVKIMVTGGAMTPTWPLWKSQYSVEEVRLLVDEAHRHGLPVAAHCHGVDGIGTAIDVGVDSIEHCSFFTDALECAPPPELLERLAASGVALSATLALSGPRSNVPKHWEIAFPRIRNAIADIHAAGGIVVIGTDAGITPLKPHDVLPFGLADLTGDIGMTTTEALAAITSSAAKVCRAEGKGWLAAGYDADIIAVDGNVSADPVSLTRTVGVWKEGIRQGSKMN